MKTIKFILKYCIITQKVINWWLHIPEIRGQYFNIQASLIGVDFRNSLRRLCCLSNGQYICFRGYAHYCGLMRSKYFGNFWVGWSQEGVLEKVTDEFLKEVADEMLETVTFDDLKDDHFGTVDSTFLLLPICDDFSCHYGPPSHFVNF